MSPTADRVTYRDWNLPYAEPRPGPFTGEAEARRRWDAEETFFVLFGDPDHPDTVLEVELGGRQVEVHWLDEHKRVELAYLFAQRDGAGGLFLVRTHLRTYDHPNPGPEDESSYDELDMFEPDGSYQAFRSHRGAGDTEVGRGQLEPDQLASMHEPALTFGDWTSIIRRDR